MSNMGHMEYYESLTHHNGNKHIDVTGAELLQIGGGLLRGLVVRGHGRHLARLK